MNTITREDIAVRAYLLWLHSDKTKSDEYYWLQAEHGLYPLGQCPTCCVRRHPAN